MPELMNFSQYARHRGCSPANITKAVANGKITPIHGKIDPEKADQEWLSNSVRLRNRKENQKLADQVSADTSAMSLSRIKAMHEGYRAKKAKLEVEQLEGTLIDAGAVKDASFKQARLVRDTLLAVPNRLAPVVTHESDEHRVFELIHDEIVLCLRAIDGTKSIHIVS
jgi:hypothetical protein